MTKKTLHIASCDKFIPPFIEFVKENFNSFEHEFLLTNGMAERELKRDKNIYLSKISILGKLIFYAKVIIKSHQAKKIILHGLFDQKFVIILFFMPWLLKKSYWIMWGGDLYVYQLGERNWKWRFRELFRRPVIRRMAYFSTTVPGDYELVKKWYSTNSKFIHNLMYQSHLYRDSNQIECKLDKGQNVFIQIGNSADPSNNHFEIIEKISKFKDRNIKVLCPLSYGSVEHREAVISFGKKMIGNKFIPIVDYMSFDEYNSYMACIDVAIFNHDRQQAMGNIIGLLSLGKKVVLKSTITPYKFFSDIGLNIYELSDDELLKKLPKEIRERNINLMRDYFNDERLRSNWEEVFHG